MKQALNRRVSRRPNMIQSLQQGTHGSGGDAIDYSLYDTMTLASTVTEIKLFRDTVGQNSKTLAHTNVISNGMIPAGQRLTIRNIKTYVYGAASISESVMVHLINAIKNTTVKFTVPGKDSQGIWPLAEMLGLSWGMILDPTATHNIDNFHSRFHGIFPLNIPVVLASLVPFELEVRHHVAPSSYLDGIQLKVSLSGVLERAA